MVTLESVLMTGLGWLVGLAASYALIFYFATNNVLGGLMRQLLGAFPAVGMTAEIYAEPSPLYALYATMVIVLAGLLAVLIPARRVAKLRPADAMRAE
jgi:ABC-type antimicrobial peptide transport system permease subunit